MSEGKSSNFSHAFLPGLILGLIIGGVCGAMLPDLLSGNKLPAPTGDHTGSSTRGERQDEQGQGEQEIIDAAIRDAETQGESAEEQAEEMLDDAEEQVDDMMSDG